MDIIFHFTFVNFPALCPKMETSFLDGRSCGHLTRSSPGWFSRTVDNEKLGKYVISFGHQISSDEPIGCLFLFSEVHVVEINQTLRGKKINAQETSGIQVHQIKSMAPELSTIVSFFCPVRNGWAFEYYSRKEFSSVQLLSCVRFFATPRTAACQASLSITNSQSLLKHMFVELVMSSNHLILRRPLLLLPSIFPSIRVFSNEYILCIRWPKYWNFSFNISPSNEYQD